MFFKFIKPNKLTLNRKKTPYFWKFIKLKKNTHAPSFCPLWWNRDFIY